jgi:hypothetical protein
MNLQTVITDLVLIVFGLVCAIRNEAAAQKAIRQQKWLWGIDDSSSLSFGRWAFFIGGVLFVVFGLVDLIRGLIR